MRNTRKAISRIVCSLALLLVFEGTARAQSCTGSQGPPPSQAAGYSLVFTDGWNPWDVSPNDSGNYNWYIQSVSGSSAPSSNVYYSDDAINLAWDQGQGSDDTSIVTASPNGQYESGFHYGYFEAMIKWDITPGSWPAFWLEPIPELNNPPASPEYGELDIFEGQGSGTEYYGTVHDWLNHTDQYNNNCCNEYTVPSMSGYHTYGVLWVPGSVSWYLDNKLLATYPSPPIFDSNTSQMYHLILGDQEGANWTYGQLVNGKPKSLNMQVKWVNVWQNLGKCSN